MPGPGGWLPPGTGDCSRGPLPIMTRVTCLFVWVDPGLGAGFGINILSGDEEIQKKAGEFVCTVRKFTLIMMRINLHKISRIRFSFHYILFSQAPSALVRKESSEDPDASGAFTPIWDAENE